jgi:hypothetical protein
MLSIINSKFCILEIRFKKCSRPLRYQYTVHTSHVKNLVKRPVLAFPVPVPVCVVLMREILAFKIEPSLEILLVVDPCRAPVFAM